MKKILIALALTSTMIFTSCSIFVRTKHTSAGGSVGQNTTAPADPSKTTATPTSK